MAFFESGNIASFSVQFLNPLNNTPVDPTNVYFKWSYDGVTYTVIEWNGSQTVPAVGLIARTASGAYVAWVDTTGHTGSVIGQFYSTGVGQSTAQPETLIIGGQQPGSGYTLSDLVETTYARLIGYRRERAVTISQINGIGPSDTSFIVSGAVASDLGAGALLSVDYEEMYVTSFNTGTSTVTVIRGWLNSNATIHANGAVCTVNSPFSRFAIMGAINDELRSMSSPTNGLFRVATTQVTYNPVLRGYDLSALPGNFIDVLDVTYKEVNPQRRYPRITSYDVRRYAPGSVTDFPSGNSLILYQEAYPGLPIQITYSAPFLPLVSPTDSVVTTPASNDPFPPLTPYSTATLSNLAPSMVDIPPLGAMIALVQPLEVARNRMGSQPEPRKAQEVPAQAIATALNPVVIRRANRISEEADRLSVAYPKRMY